MTEPAEPDEAAEALDVIRRIGGQKLLAEMAKAFLESAPQLLGDARAGVGRGDPAAVQAACHALKSSAGQLGARRLSAACARAEGAAEERRTEALAELVDAVGAELQLASRRYERELGPAV